MSQLLYLLPTLACPVGVGVMMWVMMRKPKSSTAPTALAQSQEDAELAALRVEVAQMREAAGQAGQQPTVTSALGR